MAGTLLEVGARCLSQRALQYLMWKGENVEAPNLLAQSFQATLEVKVVRLGPEWAPAQQFSSLCLPWGTEALL